MCKMPTHVKKKKKKNVVPCYDVCFQFHSSNKIFKTDADTVELLNDIDEIGANTGYDKSINYSKTQW